MIPNSDIRNGYERNRGEFRNQGRRRFKGVDSCHEGVTKSPAGIRRSRAELPTRGAKSMNNLTTATTEADGESTQANTAGGGGFAAFTRIFKWWRHSSASRDNAGATSTTYKVCDAACKEPQIVQTSVQPQHNPTYFGPLGIGQYVDDMGGGFEDTEVGNNSSPLPQKKTRSLIDISMPNIWGAEGDNNEVDDDDGNAAAPAGSPDNDDVMTPANESDEADAISRLSSNGPESERSYGKKSVTRPATILATVARLVPVPPTAPNLVQFMDSPLTSTHLYENQETTFFGHQLEERWSTPANLVTTCPQFHRGDIFNIHRVSDYVAELRLSANWAQDIRCICEGELKKYKSASKSSVAGKWQRKLALPFNSSLHCSGGLCNSKSEKEAELRELVADLSSFLDAFDSFVAQAKDELKKGPIRALLIAGHQEKLLTMNSLLPSQLMASSSASQKPPLYRKLVAEAPVTVLLTHLNGLKNPEMHSDSLALLFGDSILLAKVNSSRGGSTPARVADKVKQTAATFEVLTQLPLAFLAAQLQPQTGSIEIGIDATAAVAPASTATGTGTGNPQIGSSAAVAALTAGAAKSVYLCSSSSGISSAASTEEEEMEHSENCSLSTAFDETASANLMMWWPPNNSLQLVFPDVRSWNTWRTSLIATTDSIQNVFSNQTLRVKVQNDIAPEKCIHKYLAIGLAMTTRELKEKALGAWNITAEDTDVVATYLDASKGNVEVSLTDEGRPFLFALYITALTAEKSLSPMQTEHLDIIAADQVALNLSPKCLIFPTSPDRLPVTFVIRDITTTKFTGPKVSIEHAVADPLRAAVLHNAALCAGSGPQSRRHKVSLGLSQSTQNLSELRERPDQTQKRHRSKQRRHHRISRNSAVGGFGFTEDSPPAFGVFGRLPKEAWPDCRVSLSVMSLFVMVFYKGSLLEGIFRKSVQLSQLEAMVQRVDTNEDPLQANECSPLCAASILKNYFKNIPGHLLVDDKWDHWCKLLTLKTNEDIVAYCKKIVTELPEINQSLLTFLLFTVAQIRVNQESNLMSVEALSTVWGPNLLERPNAQPSVEDSAKAKDIVNCLLGQFTDVFCLKSVEFRQNLSSFFDQIWGQMNSNAKTKPLPEGISILELPEPKTRERTLPEIQITSPAHQLESVAIKDKRHSKLSHSHSAECDDLLVDTSTKNFLKKDSGNSSSLESAERPPPIPPRIRRRSIEPSIESTSTASPSEDPGTPPPLPTRTAVMDSPPPSASPSSFSPTIHRSESMKRPVLPKKDAISGSVTSIIDRRKSTYRRRPSPARLSAVELETSDLNAFMIGDCSGTAFADDMGSQLSYSTPSPPVPPKVTLPPESPKSLMLHRSNSDVDNRQEEKTIQFSQKWIHPRELDSTMLLNCGSLGKRTGPLFSWQTDTGGRLRGSTHRCETKWTCGLYTEPDEKQLPPRRDALKKIRPHSETTISQIHSPQSRLPPPLAKPPGSRQIQVRTRPTAIYLEASNDLRLPIFPVPKPAPHEVAEGICRRTSSIYEQKKVSDCCPKTSNVRLPTASNDGLNCIPTGGSVHLSRGSSHASTVSSTSTMLGSG